MERLAIEAFSAWGKDVGLVVAGYDVRFAESPDPRGPGTVVPYPAQSYRIPMMLEDVVETLGPCEWIALMSPIGDWVSALAEESTPAGYLTRPFVEAFAGGGIARFSAHETDALLGCLCLSAMFNTGYECDLLVVPSHARSIMMLCHHEDLHAWFRDEDDRAAFSKAMALWCEEHD